MSRRDRIGGRALVVLALLGAAAAAANTAPTTPSVRFLDDGPVVVTPGELQDPAGLPVTLVNDSFQTFALAADVSFQDQAAHGYVLVTLPANIGPSGVVQIRLTGNQNAGALAPGMYAGVLSVSAIPQAPPPSISPKGKLKVKGKGKASPVVLHRAVALEVLNEALPEGPATPGVASWTMTVYRVVPWSSRVGSIDDRDLPLAPGIQVDRTGLRSNATLGVAAREGGGMMAISWNGSVGRLSPDASTIQLAVAGSMQAGTYAGTLVLDPRATPGRVRLLVRVTDPFWWPLLAFMAGMILAWAVQRWTGMRSRVRDRLGEAVEAEAAAERADARFQDVVADRNIEVPSPVLILTARAGGVRRALRHLRGAFAGSDRERRYEAAVQDLTTIERASRIWSDLGPALVDLEDGLVRVRGAASDPPPVPPGVPEPTAPGFFVWAEGLLHREQLAVEELPLLAAEVSAARMMTAAWPRLEQEYRVRIAWAEMLHDASDAAGWTDDDRATLARADRILNGALWDLWAATDLRDLRRRAADRDLAEAERLLAQLTRPDHLDGQENAIRALDADMLSSSPIPGTAEDDVPAPLIWSEVAQPGARNVAIVVALTGVAAYAVLTVLYFGRGFGTITDYLLALTCGVVAGLVVDLIARSTGSLHRARAETVR